MSENLNRSNPDFSKYDSMSIGELEEILRTDAQGPERDDSDVDEILYVMEVLAKKRRQNGIAGKTALEAYQEFQQHYLPMVEEEAKTKRKSNIIPFRRIAALAACLVLVFSLATSAQAFGWKDIWNAVARWAEETFYFATGVEVSEPKAKDEAKYTSIQEALSKNCCDSGIAPTFIPHGYTLSDIIIDITPSQKSFLALYTKVDLLLKISVQTISFAETEQIEMSDGSTEEYVVNNTTYYIFSNHEQIRAVWVSDSYECYISGTLTIDEIKDMIVSIGKG